MLTKELLEQIETYLALRFNYEFKGEVVYRMCSVSPAALEERLKQIKRTFPQYLLNLIAERGLNEVDVYKRAHLDRRVFSKLRNLKDYMPRKRTVLSIAFAMELELDEAEDLLDRAGYSLSEFSREDAIVEFFFENGIHDLFLINEALDHYGFKPLSH